MLESPKMAGRDVMKLVVACAVSFGAALAGSFLAVGSDVPGWHDRRGRYPGRGAIHRFGRCRLVSRNYALSAEAVTCCRQGRRGTMAIWKMLLLPGVFGSLFVAEHVVPLRRRASPLAGRLAVNLVMAVCVFAVGSLAVRGVGLLGAGWIESSGFGLCSLLPLLPTIPTSGSAWSKTSRASNALLPRTRSC